MIKLIGLDVGYGFVKVSDGEVGYSFPSVIGGVSQSSRVQRMLKEVPELDDLRVEFNGKNYFVGKSAILHSQFVFRDLSSLRSDSVDFQVLFFTALSLYCNAPETIFNIVSGLPVSRMSYANTFTSLVERGAKLKRFYKNEFREFDIRVNKIEIVPQPLGTYWADVLDSHGQELKPIESRTGIVDIGYRTSDLVTVLDGEYIAEKSNTYHIGMTNAISEISSALTDKYGLELGNYALDNAVRIKKVKVSGELIDVSQIVDDALENVAVNILGNINSLWQASEYDTILLSGGGCQAIGSYILPKFKQAKMVSEPMIANCIGYMNWANHHWKNNKNDEQ